MFVLGSGNPVIHIQAPWINRLLIAACFVVYVLPVRVEAVAFIPASLFGVPGMPGPLNDWLLRLLGHLFVHGDIPHLLGNMLALWVFGANVEDAMGHGRYAVFYGLCGIAGAVAEGAMADDPMVAMVGASGAISGVMAAYLLLHPWAKLLILVFHRVPLLVPASLVVGLDLLVNVVMVLNPAAAGAGTAVAMVAWWSHLGGFACGLVLTVPFKRADVPLFHPPSTYPLRPFPRLQKWLPDFFPPPPPPSPAPPRDWYRVAFKALAYLALVGALIVLQEVLRLGVP